MAVATPDRAMGVVTFCISRSSGVCRWCSCTFEEPCPGGCGWMDAKQTLCSACAVVDVAWVDEPLRPRGTRGSHQRRVAFFRGFLAGAGDERAIDSTRQGKRQPYARGTPLYEFWRAGLEAGRQAPPGWGLL